LLYPAILRAKVAQRHRGTFILPSAFERFCTPVQLERRKPASTKFERLALDLPFGRLVGVVAGPQDGSPVLAVHGWNSQAEFFLPLILACARQGLRIHAFDMPAHGQTREANPHKPSSTLVEWVETLIALSDSLAIAHWRSVVAHSFGALAASFAIGQRPWSATQQMKTHSLSMIAGASGMPTVIESYAAGNATSPGDVRNIIEGVEAATCASLPTLAIGAVAHQLPREILIVHDPADEIAKLSDLRAELAGRPPGEELLRPAAGHDGILFQLEVGRAVAKFAAE
jgi:pimeloyl-ACP methyl ester carboxylesterase